MSLVKLLTLTARGYDYLYYSSDNNPYLDKALLYIKQAINTLEHTYEQETYMRYAQILYSQALYSKELKYEEAMNTIYSKRLGTASNDERFPIVLEWAVANAKIAVVKNDTEAIEQGLEGLSQTKFESNAVEYEIE